MSTHLPIRTLRPLVRPSSIRYTAIRPFSSSLARPKKQRLSDAGQIQTQVEHLEGKAPQTQQAELFESEDAVIDDLGLLPGTFIRGAGPRVRSLDEIKARGRYEWIWIKSRFADIVQRIYYFWRLTDWPIRSKPGFGVKKQIKMKKAAIAKYEQMYKAFASEDIKLLKTLCTSGLATDFETRIAARPMNVTMKWDLLSKPSAYLTRIVSSRATQIPLPGDTDNRSTPTAMRQVILKLQTRQRLVVERDEADSAPATPLPRRNLHWTPRDQKSAPQHADKQKESKPIERTVTEYVVMQQRMLRGKIEEWKIQGFAVPTSLDMVEQDRERRAQEESYQATNAAAMAQ